MATAVTACRSDQPPADVHAGSTMTQATEKKAEPGKYRFASQAVAVYTRYPPGDRPFYRVLMRLNHALVRGSAGVRATLQLNQTGDITRLGQVSKRPPCYAQDLELGPDDPVLEHPHPGSRVTITVRIKAPTHQTLVTHARLRRMSVPTFEHPRKYHHLAGC
jgi:hypothetical protein